MRRLNKMKGKTEGGVHYGDIGRPRRGGGGPTSYGGRGHRHQVTGKISSQVGTVQGIP